jgi:hypothetical protein
MAISTSINNPSNRDYERQMQREFHIDRSAKLMTLLQHSLDESSITLREVDTKMQVRGVQMLAVILLNGARYALTYQTMDLVYKFGAVDGINRAIASGIAPHLPPPPPMNYDYHTMEEY